LFYSGAEDQTQVLLLSKHSTTEEHSQLHLAFLTDQSLQSLLPSRNPPDAVNLHLDVVSL
jgi:hypothetical protein